MVLKIILLQQRLFFPFTIFYLSSYLYLTVKQNKAEKVHYLSFIIFKSKQASVYRMTNTLQVYLFIFYFTTKYK